MGDIFPPVSGILSYTGIRLKFMQFEIAKQGTEYPFYNWETTCKRKGNCTLGSSTSWTKGLCVSPKPYLSSRRKLTAYFPLPSLRRPLGSRHTPQESSVLLHKLPKPKEVHGPRPIGWGSVFNRCCTWCNLEIRCIFYLVCLKLQEVKGLKSKT